MQAEKTDHQISQHDESTVGTAASQQIGSDAGVFPSGPVCSGWAAAPCNTEHAQWVRQRLDDSVQAFLPTN